VPLRRSRDRALLEGRAGSEALPGVHEGPRYAPLWARISPGSLLVRHHHEGREAVSEPQWKDVTSRSRGEVDRTPRSWEWRSASLRIVVTRVHQCEGWWLLCSALDIREHHPLDSADAEEAKVEAIAFCRTVLESMLSELGGSR